MNRQHSSTTEMRLAELSKLISEIETSIREHPELDGQQLNLVSLRKRRDQLANELDFSNRSHPLKAG